MTDGVDLVEFREAFVAEADELTAAANQHALQLEGAIREGTSQGRHVRELFRAVHTIKGLAAMVSVEPIVTLSHSLEEILRSADRDGLALSRESVDTILSALEAITQRIRSVAIGQAVAEPPNEVMTSLASVAGIGRVAPKASTSETFLTLDASVSVHLSPSDRQQLVLGAAEGKRALRVDFSPSPELAAHGDTITSLRERLGTIAEVVRVVPMTNPAAPSGLSFVLLVLTKADDAQIKSTIGSSDVPLLEVVAQRISSTEMTPDSVASGDALRVDVNRLDVALERLSDLVLTRFRLQRAVTALKEQGVDVRDLAEAVKDNARHLRALRTAVLRVRMLPLEELFARMRLVVRGSTRASNKRVKLELDAGNNEVDKSVADQVFPAILHLARNAIDHGIELPHVRQHKGKPIDGTLRLTCRQVSSNQIEIVVEDDGGGIDSAAVCKRAGVAPADSDAALLEVLCRPGFSTRDAADATSGRGMGMDIVRRAIVDTLGGELTLETHLGKGTRFTLRVPLTISIVEAFIFECGSQRFVTPAVSIDEAVDLGRVTYPRGDRIGVLEHRGATVPFVELTTLLGLPRAAPSRQGLVVRQHGALLALGVAKVLTQQEIVVRPLDDKLVKTPGISGSTDLGDGRPTLVLDLARLAQTRLAS